MKISLFIISVYLFLGTWASPRQGDKAQNGQRIVGGSDTTIEEYPYAAQLYLEDSFQCGACIISTKWVLTAGHCTEGEDTTTITLRVGASKFNQTDDDVITLAEIHTHPLYSESSSDYDISALLLTKELTFGKTIGSVRLPSANVALVAGTLATIVGWGYLNETTAVLPTQLQVVQVPIITNEECARRYNNTVNTITDKTLCAGYDKGGKDACTGDSGGPMTVDGVLYGIISRGLGCADPKYPGIYTNISSLRSYIQEVTGL